MSGDVKPKFFSFSSSPLWALPLSYLLAQPLINALSHVANDVSLINYTSLPSYSSKENEIMGAAFSFSCDRPWVDSTFWLGVLFR